MALSPGTYYVVCRNESNSSNGYDIELDYPISLPSSDNCTFYDDYLSTAQNVSSGGNYAQTFTVNQGYRYYIDGGNSGLDFYLIGASDVSAFESGVTQLLQSYFTFSGDRAQPGLYELKLNPGSYALAFYKFDVSIAICHLYHGTLAATLIF